MVFYFPLNNQHLLIYYQPLLGQISTSSLLSIRNIFYILKKIFCFILCCVVFVSPFYFLCVFCWGFFVCILLCYVLFLLVFVCFCFVFVCFCFCFCLLFIYLVCHSNLYRTLIVFNIALAWRTTILKRT